MSMMSAPASIIFCAWCSASSGLTNCPPSENESGVMLRMPMTNGRFFDNRRASTFGRLPNTLPVPRDGSTPSVVMAGRFACQAPRSQAVRQGRTASTVGNLKLNPLGLLDPALDGAGGGQHAGELVLGVGRRHRLGELARVAVFELLDRIDAGGLQQVGIFAADPLDPH